MQEEQWRKIKGTIIFVLGIMLVLYPLFTDLYSGTVQDNKWADYKNAQTEDSAENPAVENASEQNQEPRKFTEALLKIPTIDLSTVVVPGTSQDILKKALGWYEQSALPGEGNTAIAGHRTMHGGFFRNLHRLTPGDIILLEYEGYVYRYRVGKVYQVQNDDWSVIEPCDYTALTLTTCVKGDTEHRQVVRAVFCDKEIKGD
jgi:sortase A